MCKGNYFTIEFKDNKFVAELYITFKYDKHTNNFLLHRYGYIDLSGGTQEPKREVQLTTKDFGEIFFEDFYAEQLDYLIDDRFSKMEE